MRGDGCGILVCDHLLTWLAAAGSPYANGGLSTRLLGDQLTSSALPAPLDWPLESFQNSWDQTAAHVWSSYGDREKEQGWSYTGLQSIRRECNTTPLNLPSSRLSHMKSFATLCSPLAMDLNSTPSRFTSGGYLHSITLPVGHQIHFYICYFKDP